MTRTKQPAGLTVLKQRITRLRPRSVREPDLTSLINIVFLILIFFIVAGTLRPFSNRDIKLAKVANEAVSTTTPGRLIVDRDGEITFAARNIQLNDLPALFASSQSVRVSQPFTIIADGRAPGRLVLSIARTAQQAGLKDVTLMVERGRR